MSPQLPGNGAPEDLIIVLAIVAVLLWAGSSGRQVHLPYVVPMAVLLGAGALAALFGSYPAHGMLALLQDTLLLAWCAAVANVGQSAPALRVLMRTWSISATAWAGLMVAAAITGHAGLSGSATQQGRAALTFGNPNIAADYFVISFMVVLAGSWPRRVLPRVLSCALILAAIVMTGSLAGLGGLIVGVVVTAAVSAYRRWALAPALAALAVMALVVILLALGASRSHLLTQSQASSNSLVRNSLGRGDRSTVSHSDQLRRLVGLYWTNGPFGIGPASTKLFLQASGAPWDKEAHDDYLAVLVERGWLGEAGLVMLIGALAFRAARLVRASSFSAAGVLRSTAPLIGALAAVGFGSVTHEVLHFRHAWTLFGLIAALYLMDTRPEAEPEPAFAHE